MSGLEVKVGESRGRGTCVQTQNELVQEARTNQEENRSLVEDSKGNECWDHGRVSGKYRARGEEKLAQKHKARQTGWWNNIENHAGEVP